MHRPLSSQPVHASCARGKLWAVLCAVFCTFCGSAAPRPAPLGRPSTSSSGTSSPVAILPASASPEASSNAFCSTALADAQRAVGQIDTRPVTQCEVQLLAVWSLREGLAMAPEAELLRQWISLELQAVEARSRGLDQGVGVQSRIREILAGGAIRAEARQVFRAPTPEQIRQYYDSHVSDFTQEVRVHTRAIALRTQRAATAMLATLRANNGAQFTEFATHQSVLRNAARDAGDLGLINLTQPFGVPDDIVRTALSLTTDGEIHPGPVRVEVLEPVRAQSGRPGTRRRRPQRPRRPHRIVQWWIVQRLERTEEQTLTLADVSRRIAARLGQEQWLQLLAQARSTLVTAGREAQPAIIVDSAFGLVRLRASETP